MRRLALAEQQVAQRLPHQVAPGEAEEDRELVNRLVMNTMVLAICS
jgi:hypothetical protein